MSNRNNIKLATASSQFIMEALQRQPCSCTGTTTNSGTWPGFLAPPLASLQQCLQGQRTGSRVQRLNCTGSLLCLGSNGTYGAVLAWPLTSVTWIMASVGSASSHQQPIQYKAVELFMGPVKPAISVGCSLWTGKTWWQP